MFELGSPTSDDVTWTRHAGDTDRQDAASARGDRRHGPPDATLLPREENVARGES